MFYSLTNHHEVSKHIFLEGGETDICLKYEKIKITRPWPHDD